MKILIVSATLYEIESLFDNNQFENLEITTLITGVGMTSTTYSLTKTLIENKFDLAINLGLAGSFDRTIELGNVVNITTDTFSELGAEDGGDFIKLKDLGLNDPKFDEEITNNNSTELISINQLRKVSGITVNKVHGNENSILEVKKHCDPDVESMEGAAFLYVCQQENLPCYQIRAISNYVEKRSKENWKIEEAIKNLHNFTIQLLNELKN
ncbi:MAG: futalosine hydrolase [Bacteroidetes bacterium]|nr:MAG: futalosine hydrolase [Bacteroidota bacterium]